MLRKRHSFLLYFIIILLCNSCVSAEKKPLNEIIGSDMQNILIKSHQLVPFILRPEKLKEDEKETRMMGLFFILDEATPLNAKQKQTLINILSQDVTVLSADEVDMTPDYCLIIKQEDNKMVVYIDIIYDINVFSYNEQQKVMAYPAN